VCVYIYTDIHTCRYDVILAPHVGDLHRYIDSGEGGILFAAERDCWPDAVQCRWLTRAPFLNAGVFAGKASAVLRMLEDMRSMFEKRKCIFFLLCIFVY
jgi:hypothetical protein